ncbi:MULTISPECIES: fumarylacetoacetate hydrolase family protein [unclassified Sphingobium]|uniref:fumarylacetoacetate hydrolase family protein n=1 Tax=unclassified Sphingobium TaxID=2611147 RepID=UPI000D15BB0F|nr:MULTISPECIES: fumarylacetoacetate hydrolase family protein [unclassified Sphingobium]MBG6119944.1 2-keto-4-pentenoate hydratase/2-oxohepta-3-ene-1,7-dioic acid hydratase in catechol pathway [Sphingobium sp. JAI105]PSO11889.1 2-hydroxyhepta-2,4-diene-1,7-dioate isomerase [Sphingobium sp. AEW4]TWC99617.1 2-keto-4-pentenoate hydratase/2-oxohepta-3-ene-1,7-dioic acid hydratase in catechol pathway [Sphingobium sp. AEW010]TWD18946.1 2-keto-4-pentenoate hydratase/2-oxohepta-3-ene-1,7-dioic acid hyd
MLLVRYDHAGSVQAGFLEGAEIHPCEGSIAAGFAPMAEAAAIPLAQVRLLAPVVPGKIVAVGPNYRAHLAGRPLPSRPFLWIKPPSTLANPGDPIMLPDEDADAVYNHESELAIVIGRRGRHIPVERAASYIFGYSCINDVTAGDMTDKAAFRASAAFVDGKIHDSFAPIGPAIATGFDPDDVRILCRVNGEVRQDHRSSDMIWSCAELVARISRVMTLEPGDVIATGSPPGSAPMRQGDRVEVEIAGIGILANPVVGGAA